MFPSPSIYLTSEYNLQLLKLCFFQTGPFQNVESFETDDEDILNKNQAMIFEAAAIYLSTSKHFLAVDF